MTPSTDALVDIMKMRQVIVDLGSWASAALDDPTVCAELKEIFGRVVELAVKYDPELEYTDPWEDEV